jgi:hypothetical protein
MRSSNLHGNDKNTPNAGESVKASPRGFGSATRSAYGGLLRALSAGVCFADCGYRPKETYDDPLDCALGWRPRSNPHPRLCYTIWQRSRSRWHEGSGLPPHLQSQDVHRPFELWRGAQTTWVCNIEEKCATISCWARAAACRQTSAASEPFSLLYGAGDGLGPCGAQFEGAGDPSQTLRGRSSRLTPAASPRRPRTNKRTCGIQSAHQG